MTKPETLVDGSNSTVTVKEVAERAAVSTATVSRVLSGSAGVRDPLKKRVLDAVRLLAYRPNRAARNLRVGSSRAVGVLIPDVENPFYTSVVCGIEDVLKETDYSLILANYNENPEQEARRLDCFRAEGIRGLIFSASRSPSTRYVELQRAGLAMVAVSRLQKGLQIDHVMVANRDGAYAATAHLIRHGHKRVGIINGPLVLTTARDRQSGYDDALREAGLPVDEKFVVHCDFRQEAGRAAMNQLLDLPDAPTAVFAASNLLTLGALQAIHERDLDIPGQIAILGFDEMPWAMSLRPPLTTVEQPAFELGRTAAQLLLERINKPALPPRRVILGTRLIVRSSCGAEGGEKQAASVGSLKNPAEQTQHGHDTP